MCTNIVETAALEGTGRGAHGWFSLARANVTYDHPFQLAAEYALNIDFVNPSAGVDQRVAVELTAASARRLAEAILTALERARPYDSSVEVSPPA